MNLLCCKKINLSFLCCTLFLANIVVAEENNLKLANDNQFDVLLNKQIFHSLSQIQGNATVSFEGSVVRQIDGSLRISIDGVDNVSVSRSFLGAGSSKGDIQYVTFEAMGGSKQDSSTATNENEVNTQSLCKENQVNN